jgi:hypothetical protein
MTKLRNTPLARERARRKALRAEMEGSASDI